MNIGDSRTEVECEALYSRFILLRSRIQSKVQRERTRHIGGEGKEFFNSVGAACVGLVVEFIRAVGTRGMLENECHGGKEERNVEVGESSATNRAFPRWLEHEPARTLEPEYERGTECSSREVRPSDRHSPLSRSFHGSSARISQQPEHREQPEPVSSSP